RFLVRVLEKRLVLLRLKRRLSFAGLERTVADAGSLDVLRLVDLVRVERALVLPTRGVEGDELGDDFLPELGGLKGVHALSRIAAAMVDRRVLRSPLEEDGAPVDRGCEE